MKRNTQLKDAVTAKPIRQPAATTVPSDAEENAVDPASRAAAARDATPEVPVKLTRTARDLDAEIVEAVARALVRFWTGRPASADRPTSPGGPSPAGQ